MLVQVSEQRCRKVAERLTTVGVPPTTEPWSVASDQVAYDLATLNLLLVAICHQAQTLSGTIEGRPLRGWDYLQGRLLAAARLDSHFLAPHRMNELSADTLRSLLHCGDQWTDDDLQHRALLVRDCGEKLMSLGATSCSELYVRCQGRIASGNPNLLDTLSNFQAFNDPVRKKALFLLGLNQTTCQWVYTDPDMLDPPVDYHETRGHLRIGTVQIVDTSLAGKVARREEVGEAGDVAIRSAVTEAIRMISARSGFTPMQLHYAFWNLFRSICLRGTPRCRGEIADLVVAEYRHLVEGDACCFRPCCLMADASRALDEHKFDTDWY